MNTQSHVILNLFFLRKLFGSRVDGMRNFNVWVFIGSILPDVPMFIFFLYYTLIDVTPQHIIWDQLYFSSAWQEFFNVFNSIPIFLGIVLLAYAYKKRAIFVVGLAGLLHFLGDFFLHQEDGHAHLYPLSDYMFYSPVSYWNPAYGGHLFSIFETLLVLGISFYVYEHLKTKWGKTLLVLANAFSILGFLFWYVLLKFF